MPNTHIRREKRSHAGCAALVQVATRDQGGHDFWVGGGRETSNTRKDESRCVTSKDEVRGDFTARECGGFAEGKNNRWGGGVRDAGGQCLRGGDHGVVGAKK